MILKHAASEVNVFMLLACSIKERVPEHTNTFLTCFTPPPCCPQGPSLIPVCCADLPCAIFNSSTTKLGRLCPCLCVPLLPPLEFSSYARPTPNPLYLLYLLPLYLLSSTPDIPRMDKKRLCCCVFLLMCVSRLMTSVPLPLCRRLTLTNKW